MRLARSSGFFKPANTIFVPGMYLVKRNKSGGTQVSARKHAFKPGELGLLGAAGRVDYICAMDASHNGNGAQH